MVGGHAAEDLISQLYLRGLAPEAEKIEICKQLQLFSYLMGICIAGLSSHSTRCPAVQTAISAGAEVRVPHGS